MRHMSALLSLSLVATAACGGDCTTILVPGIVVFLNDDLSNVTVTATEGSFTETVNVNPGASTASLVYERAGTYHVEVTAPGYAPWTMSNVRVEEDDCHVITVELTDWCLSGGNRPAASVVMRQIAARA